MAARVGSEVVYLAGLGVTAGTMTPYDVCALRLGDGTVLAGSPPDDAVLYLAALRRAGAGAAATTAAGEVVATGLSDLVERVSGMPWSEAESRTRGAGALVGAYPAELPS